MKQAHVGMEHSKTSQTRSEQYHNTFIPSLHLANYALCLLVVWIRGLWKAVGRVVLGVYCVLMCMESVLCCGWLQCCSKCFQVPYRSSTAHSFCIQDSLNLPDCVQCWIYMVYVGSYVVKFYCCWMWQIWKIFNVESCGVSSADYHVHLVGVNRLSACRDFFGVYSRQNGTRCRDGVNVFCCHYHLVWLVVEGSFPTCACFHSENIFVTCSCCFLY